MASFSKVKTRRRLSTDRSANGRLFCIVGKENKCSAPESSVKTNLIGQLDSDTSTSGYLSSSLESSSEYFIEQNVYNLKSNIKHAIYRPNTSTPKQGSESIPLRKLFQHETNKSSRSMLSIKKNFNKSIKSDQEKFWDVEASRKIIRCSSENDVNKNIKESNCYGQNSSQDLEFHYKNRTVNSQNWKRRPYMTQSTSALDSRLYNENVTGNKLTKQVKSMSYIALPRYRVKVDEDPVATKSSSLEGGVPVDESMSDFLSNVDRENLASFLMFYDKVTNSGRHAYDAVYY